MPGGGRPADAGSPSVAPLADRPVEPWASGSDVVLVTRRGCHLCEQAEPLARSVCEELGASLALVDVDADAELRSRFTHHVPVTLVRGRMLDYWALDEERLRRALRGEPVEAPAPL